MAFPLISLCYLFYLHNSVSLRCLPSLVDEASKAPALANTLRRIFWYVLARAEYFGAVVALPRIETPYRLREG
jgi:hypothetical protein